MYIALISWPVRDAITLRTRSSMPPAWVPGSPRMSRTGAQALIACMMASAPSATSASPRRFSPLM